MKKTFIRFLAVMTATCSFAFAIGGWEDDFETAKAAAAKDNKPMLLDFTGSDWCGWCMKLDGEVFSKKEFKSYAKDNLVLVKLDFPHQKHQSKKLKEQNEQLARKYRVQGYPTILLVDAEGKEIARTGYVEGGPGKYVDHLKELLDKAKK